MEGKISKKARSSDNGVNGNARIEDENILGDILSRLPVKSLMRFKCVEKQWYSLIKDPHFIHLHFNRPKAYRLFIVTSRQKNAKGNLLHIDYSNGVKRRQRCVSFYIADVFVDGSSTITSTINQIGKNKPPFSYTQVLRAVNGVVCFINASAGAACVFNIATREVTPWIKSTVLMEEIPKSRWNRRRDISAYSFGYDPSSKKHKVVCKWVIYDHDDDASYNFWEVLTVGHNAWRRIDHVPNCRFAKDSPYVYVNGSIYWYPLNFLSENSFASVTFLLAFDVGTEKFTRIQIPDGSGQLNPGVSFRFENVCLLDMQSRVSILCQTQSCTARIWIYEDNNKKWTRKSILLPFSWGENPAHFFHAAAEADRIFIETHPRSDSRKPFAISLRSYYFKDNTIEEIRLQGIPSADQVLKYTKLCTPFCESLIF